MSEYAGQTILWIVGKRSPQDADEHGFAGWDLIGVFDDGDVAVSACQGHPDYFVGPVLLNVCLGDDPIPWPESSYPAGAESMTT